MYYLDATHKANFATLLLEYDRAMDGDRHFRTACYVTAIPEIYSQVKEHIETCIRLFGTRLIGMEALALLWIQGFCKSSMEHYISSVVPATKNST